MSFNRKQLKVFSFSNDGRDIETKMYDSAWNNRRRNVVYPHKTFDIFAISKSTDFSNTNLIESDVFLKNTNFLYGFMKVTALYLISIDMKTGKHVYNFFSLQTLYFLVNYAIITFASIYVLTHNFLDQSTRKSQMDNAIFSYHYYIFFVLHFIPLVTFIEMKKMAEYRNKWALLQAKYNLVTGKLPNINLRRNTIFLGVFLTVLETTALALIYLRFSNQKGHQEWEIIMSTGYFGYVMLLAGLMLGHWITITNGLKSMSLVLISDIEDFGSKKSKSNLAAYEDLWRDLSLLIRTTGSTFWLSTTAMIMFLFLMLTISSYSSIAQFNASEPSTLLETISPFVFTASSFACMTAMNVSSHNAVKSAGEDFQNVLLQIKVTELSEENKKTLDRFLHILSASPPVINLGGFYVIDKSLNTSLVGTLVTYLIVLLQFRFST